MNKRKIVSIIGKIILMEALLMVPSLIVSLIYGDGDAMAFVYTIIPAVIIGRLLSRVKQSDQRISSRDGYFIVASAWIFISLIGAVPLYISGGFQSYWNALFEIVSGFTTTGASVLAKPEDLGHGIIFWRSFTHWIGGMGVLVFVLMVMPMENDNSMHLVRAEVPGPTAGKLVPRMRTTSMILYGIYTIMTFILLLLLICGKMPVFDSFCIAFGTAGTGGFGVSSAGIAGYNSLYLEIVIGIFMLLFGINFNVYHLILLRKIGDVLKSEEVKVYLGIVAFATVTIALNILSLGIGAGRAFRDAFFQVSSIITTTGFATVDYNFWPEFSKHTIVMLMIIGACAGSTGGGFKISRMIILVKSFFAEIRRIITPKAVITVRLDSKPVDKQTLNSTKTYMGAYMILICIFTLILSLDGLDLTTNLTAVLSCFNNIGPGLELVGPMNNFSVYSDWAQVLLSVVMLTGRLEIFPMFLLFAKSTHGR
ncbi:MAG: TrkH family potassium uptake protein [Lachnospiraceae bacterium]|nr:TrkH family potassium uptake protein [Lachnospiraceae bacterium]MBD5456505.1 TrkH family potassium uptake protein [Lachnospiraceae bacterium]